MKHVINHSNALLKQLIIIKYILKTNSFIHIIPLMLYVRIKQLCTISNHSLLIIILYQYVNINTNNHRIVYFYQLIALIKKCSIQCLIKVS